MNFRVILVKYIYAFLKGTVHIMKISLLQCLSVQSWATFQPTNYETRQLSQFILGCLFWKLCALTSSSDVAPCSYVISLIRINPPPSPLFEQQAVSYIKHWCVTRAMTGRREYRFLGSPFYQQYKKDSSHLSTELYYWLIEKQCQGCQGLL